MNLKTGYLLLAFVPLAIAGCVSSEEVDQDRCASFGYRPGSGRFADCMMEQNSQRAEERQRSQDRIAAEERRNRDRKEARRREESANIDTRPSFDRDGNPNFDTQGNYQGCHGVGCDVDNPDEDD